MAVAVSATGTATHNVGAATQTYTFTVNASDTLAVFIIQQDNASANAISTVTWDQGGTNQACTLVGNRTLSTATNGSINVYAVVNPTSGTKTLQVVQALGQGMSAELQSYTGTVTTSVAAACTNALTNAGTTVGTNTNQGTVAQTGVTGDMYVSAYCVNGTVNSVTDNVICNVLSTRTIAGNNFASAGATHQLTAQVAATSTQWSAVSFDIVAPVAVSLTSYWYTPWQDPVRREIITTPDEAYEPVLTAAPGPATTGGSVFNSDVIFTWQLIYQAKAEPVFVLAPAVVNNGWFASWQNPVRFKPALSIGDHPYFFFANPPLPGPATTGGTIFQSDVTFNRQFIYQAKTEPVFVFPTAAVNNGWFVPWPDFAPRARSAVDFKPWSFVPSPAQVFFPYAPWDDFTRRKPQPLDTQPLIWTGQPIASPAPVMAWTNWPDFAPKARAPLNFDALALVQPVPQVFFPYGPWDDFTRRRPQYPDTQPLAWTGQNIAAPAPTMAWLRWPDFAPKKPVPLNFDPQALVQLAPQIWYPPIQWPEIVPYRQKPAADFIPWSFVAPFPAFPWTQWVSWPDVVPTRKKPVVDFQPWTFLEPPPQVWFPYGPWDDFTRRKPQPLDTQPLIWSSFTPAPSFFLVPERWPDFVRGKTVPLNYNPLTLVQTVTAPWTMWTQWPDRIWRKAPPVDTGPFTAFLQIARTPWNEMSHWPDFAPIRGKAGLHAALQAFSARFPGTITQAAITGVMSAFETNSDTAAFTIYVVQSQPAVSAAISIQEIGP